MEGIDLQAAEIFLASFNRIEKYLQTSLSLDKSIGFTNMVRMARKKENEIGRAHV